MAGINLFDIKGHRKYLSQKEREAFLVAAEKAPREVRTFCGVLVYTGCRISEALAVTADRVDLSDGVIIFETIKRRKLGIFRAVPVPPQFLEALELVHSLRGNQKKRAGKKKIKLWPWGRATAWRRVKEVLDVAGIKGAHASPKGLRHGFGIAAVSAGIPLNMVQKWLGHAQLMTTAIYADAVGVEEKELAAKMW